MRRIVFSVLSAPTSVRESLGWSRTKRRRNRGLNRVLSAQAGRFGNKLVAASMLLLISAPQLFQVRAYAQYHDQPATVNTVPQNFSLDAGSNIQTVAGIGAGLPQSVIITTADKLPSGTSTDSQSGSGNNAPAVPPTPGMASVDAVGGLIPVVSGITLTPDVPTLVNAAVAPASLPSASSVTASSPGSSPTDVAAPSSCLLYTSRCV